jgi:hypothetical protein
MSKEKYKNDTHQIKTEDEFEFPTDTKKLKINEPIYCPDGTDRAFRDYDPKKDTRKYPVYRNDIKFKKHRDVDPDRAIWDPDVKDDFYSKETDSIEYRLEECRREKYETLDISHMKQNCFDMLVKNRMFSRIKCTVQHLLAKDCGLQSVPDLSGLTSLVTLDLSCNELKDLPELPESLEELIVNDNRLTRIANDLPGLKRFNGKNNMIASFNYSNSLESIYLSNNPINYIPSLSNIYYLDISTTEIKNLHHCPDLKYLDCSYTELQVLPELKLLEYLQCNESQISDIGTLPNLRSLEMINTNITRVSYMKNLGTLIYHHDNKFGISTQYKIQYVKKNKNNITEITFKIPEP